MQAVISRTGRPGRTPLAVLALVAGLTLGGVGGYSINGLLRPSLTTPAAAHIVNSSSDFAVSAARHAATERAEAGDLLGSELAVSAARHAASERAEADAVSP
jgi:hypothetical protein